MLVQQIRCGQGTHFATDTAYYFLFSKNHVESNDSTPLLSMKVVKDVDLEIWCMFLRLPDGQMDDATISKGDKRRRLFVELFITCTNVISILLCATIVFELLHEHIRNKIVHRKVNVRLDHRRQELNVSDANIVELFILTVSSINARHKCGCLMIGRSLGQKKWRSHIQFISIVLKF
jgi:hypothetical protein